MMMSQLRKPGAPLPSREDFNGRACLVLGAARSGLAAAERLATWGAQVTVYDRNPERLLNLEGDYATLTGPELPSFEAYRWVIQSPGVPVPTHSSVVPEVDLAALALRAPSIGVTGTNGKSTTTVLIGAMLKGSGMPVEVGGNLGTPLCVLGDRSADWVVVELSSFQLEHARWLHPRVAVLLNLADDHLDRHHTLAAYGAAKERLAELLEPEGILVFNLDDAWAAGVAARLERRGALGFSTRNRPARGAYLEGDELVLAPAGNALLRIPLENVGPSLRAHPGNVLASMLAADAAGASHEAIREVVESFQGLPHRAQVVDVKAGVTYVDDSKATNPHAAIASLASAKGPIVWLAGGANKGLDFKELAIAAERARVAIVYGQCAPELAAALQGHTEVVRTQTLEQAVHEAARRAHPGDVVLLSPACASFDQFTNFEARGDHFAAVVRALPC